MYFPGWRLHGFCFVINYWDLHFCFIFFSLYVYSLCVTISLLKWIQNSCYLNMIGVFWGIRDAFGRSYFEDIKDTGNILLASLCTASGVFIYYSSFKLKISLRYTGLVYLIYFIMKYILKEHLVMYLQVKTCFSSKCCHNSVIPLKYSSNVIQSFNLYASWIIIMTYMQMQLRVLIYANKYNFQLDKYFSNSVARVAFFRKWLPTTCNEIYYNCKYFFYVYFGMVKICKFYWSSSYILQ